MDRMSSKTRKILTVSIISFMTLLTVVVSIIEFRRIADLMYSERATNLGILMDKITQNFDTAMKSHWNDVTFCENQLEDAPYVNDAEVIKRFSNTQKWLSTDATIILIGTNRQTLTIDGRPFKWPKDHIPQDNREVFISDIEGIGSSMEQMIFVSKLSKKITLNNKLYTHIALAWPTALLNDYFIVSNYGGQSMSYIITDDGTQLYKQNKKNEFSNIANIYETILNSKFLHGTSKQKFESDIKNSQAGCVSFIYNDEPNFAIYKKMNTNNWHAILVAPEKRVGINSSRFMSSLVAYIAIIAIFILALLVTIIIIENRRLLYKQETANMMLKNAAEAEHKANQAKTAFLSSMSHDIRTPMNAIIGMTAIAQKHLDNEERIKECLTKIDLAGKHLLTLINDILDISKIESGRMTLNPVVFSIADSTTNMVNVVRPQIHAKNLQFDVRIHKIHNEYVCADELRLNQIFINLLSNAVKYTPENGSISLDLKELEIPGKPEKIRLIYSIQDTGVGMTKEYQKTMYDAFSRANSQNTAKIQGAGLGLAITKQMVDLMHGTIECQSAPGEGTKFVVTLDLELADKSSRNLSLPPLHTLIVDDDEIFLESSSDTLSSMGMIVETSNNGKDAVEKICARHEMGTDYTLVIVDWKMPEMNGLETTREIRKKVGSDVPIILVSSYDWTEIEEDAKLSGVDGFIGKPFFRSTVYYELKKVLQIEDPDEQQHEDGTHDLRDMNILIAEDIDVNWDIIHEWLEMYGIKSERAVDGKNCLEMLTNSPKDTYNLILMDIQMPVMDGKEASKAIRDLKDETLNSIPIIAMTADAFAEDIESSLNAGMDGHVAKPVDIENLFQEIRRVLKNRHNKK